MITYSFIVLVNYISVSVRHRMARADVPVSHRAQRRAATQHNNKSLIRHISDVTPATATQHSLPTHLGLSDFIYVWLPETAFGADLHDPLQSLLTTGAILVDDRLQHQPTP